MSPITSLRLTTVAAVCAILLALPVSATATNWTVGATVTKGGQAASSTFVLAPTGVTDTCPAFVGTKINVAWTASVGATGYKIYVSTTSSSAGFSLVASGVTGTSWTSGSLPNATYWYSVSATYGSSGETAATAAVLPRYIQYSLFCT